MSEDSRSHSRFSCTSHLDPIILLRGVHSMILILNRILNFNNYRQASKIYRNCALSENMSVKKLIEKDYEINFNKEWCTIKNKDNALAKADKLKKFSKILIVKNWDVPNSQHNCKIGNYDVGLQYWGPSTGENTDEWLLAMAIVKSCPCWVKIFKTWLRKLEKDI
uniref:Uncharacterized protein n=1 Tax=Vespula pensylvanica TaxID=30213 RepID=A0A834NKH2_VESPE|nr:hypothetical protein H0235_012608 [Vespula pensylvanica]